MFELVPVVDVRLRPGILVPPLLEPLVAAARRGEDLVSRVKSVVASFGFDTFEYGVCAGQRPDRHDDIHVFTTVPEWTAHYERMGYVETDPRIFLPCRSAVPTVWDQRSVRGLGPRADAFLDDARRHGIASGVSFVWREPHDAHVAVALNSRVDFNDDIRAKAIMRNLPDIFMFGRYFHEVLMLPALERGKPPSPSTPSLSSRERECLALAANGLTTRDISHRLDISSRTVQFHFGNICSKLRASNRQEAVARGVQSGIVRTG
jgi:LuxR family quorum-sensing system transcriptional regulator SolR